MKLHAEIGRTSLIFTMKNLNHLYRATCAKNCPAGWTYTGEERTPLDLSGLPEILDGFRQEGVQAVAISFLHSYANTAHEIATLAEVQRLWPEISVVSSHQITREWREYERTNTAVLSAYIQPVAARYLHNLDAGLRSPRVQRQPLYYAIQLRCGLPCGNIKNSDHDC